ncbi:hypothetical protein [Halorubrum tibetense]|uniref:Uncharacterized protein n=1 Tax=Halorubrum tibetense TaxID=175631 RepID=A0ABD5S9A0_9EURY
MRENGHERRERPDRSRQPRLRWVTKRRVLTGMVGVLIGLFVYGLLLML